MASRSNDTLLLLAVVLLSVFAAASASGTCVPGVAFQSNLLPSCRDYVLQQTCGVFTPGSRLAEEMAYASVYSPGKPYLAKLGCCQELAEISESCRCEALRYFLELPVPSRPVDLESGRPVESGLMDLQGCPREMQREFVRLLVAPGQCNLPTVNKFRYCPAVNQPQWI